MQIALRILLFGFFALALWGYRWAYTSYVIVALSWMIVQSGFEMHSPHCEMFISLDGAALSMTKFGHILLFGLFFVITVRQFNKFDRRSVLFSILATLVMGLLVEIIEGATGAGNCRMRDLVPDVAGALIAAGIVGVLVAGRRRLTTFD